jgi:hypothetical protein
LGVLILQVLTLSVFVAVFLVFAKKGAGGSKIENVWVRGFRRQHEEACEGALKT